MMSAEERLDRIFQALSDSTRRQILRRISAGELTVGEIASPFSMSLAAVSKHLKVLEDAGLVEKSRAGRRSLCSIRLQGLEEADHAIRELSRYWEERLDELESFLRDRRSEEEDG